ncbi:MAG: UDP-N-acetylglucosamine 1-carboxyvinyltransferase [Candidatus Babeliales bacterium]
MNQQTYSDATSLAVHYDEHLSIEQSPPLSGVAHVYGAKNAVLVMMAATILADGISELSNVPDSADVRHMMQVLTCLGVQIIFDAARNYLYIDTRHLNAHVVPVELMNKMRASVLVMGPLLARLGKAEIAIPGGCSIGARPVNYHMKNFQMMGATIKIAGESVCAQAQLLCGQTIVLEYPSVGATENTIMAATLAQGTTRIINAALEPEVMNLIEMLQKMGASIGVLAPNTIEIVGVRALHAVHCEVIPDRLEAGTLLLAAAITGGSIFLPNARPDHMDVFLLKLEEMGHSVQKTYGQEGIGLRATSMPKAVSYTTAQYPGFPTDLQAPFMAAVVLAQGKSLIHESVYENRLIHVEQLQKMGAQISVQGDKAQVIGVAKLMGADLLASDIRASSALVLAGLAAEGVTRVFGVHHWKRGYQNLEIKIAQLGGKIRLKTSH